MPNYDIYILPESELTISGGAVLDGVTQGDGTHLVSTPPDAPITITLDSNSWQPINVTDNNTEFTDSQGSNQTSTNAHTIDGQFFAAGTNVEAEYAITVTDGTNSYTLIAFNFSTGSPAYGTVEALAFIGPVGGFPPVGVPLTVTASQEGPSNPAGDHAAPPCFAKGTLIRTPDGERLVERISCGEMVETQDHGPQPVRWIGVGTYPGIGNAAPIRFETGAIGNSRPLLLSPQHRVLFAGWKADYLFGAPHVLIPAHCFVDDKTVFRAPTGFVTYVHLMFDHHEIIYSEGVPTESLFVGGAKPGGAGAVSELSAFFPQLRAAKRHVSAAPSLKPYEASLILAG